MNAAWERVVANTREEAGIDAEGWISAVSAAIPELAERWSLHLGQPFDVATISYVLPAERADGMRAVLKLIYPGYEETPFTQEVAGLRMWDGRGIIRLLEADEALGAQLLERAEPGDALSAEPDELHAIGTAAGVLERLWSAPTAPHPDIRTLAQQARICAATIESSWRGAGEPVERALIEDVRKTFESLAADLDGRPGGELVLVHGDLHHGNVLSARREPWLAIDPKPMLGAREYDLRAPLCDRADELLADQDPLARLERRLDTLLGSLGAELDRDHALAWAFVVSVDWSLWGVGQDDPFARNQMEIARLVRTLRG
jgi:streptomycin 6-kinase